MLFTPYRLGTLELPNRIVMPPMTRSRAASGNVPTASMAEYYAQRASAGLIVTEGTQISQQGQGYAWTPGIHSPEQVTGWRGVTDAVHAAGGRIFAQLWHVGRVSHVSLQPGGSAPVSSSPLVAEGGYLTFDLSAPDGASDEAPAAIRRPERAPEAAAGAAATLFAPAVGAFAFTGNLAPAALWRIVGDGLAWGWVQAGAHERGQAVLTASGAPFANRQLRLERGAVRQRGGCCRWLAVNGETCANCPLRKTGGKTERKTGG